MATSLSLVALPGEASCGVIICLEFEPMNEIFIQDKLKEKFESWIFVDVHKISYLALEFQSEYLDHKLQF